MLVSMTMTMMVVACIQLYSIVIKMTMVVACIQYCIYSIVISMVYGDNDVMVMKI